MGMCRVLGRHLVRTTPPPLNPTPPQCAAPHPTTPHPTPHQRSPAITVGGVLQMGNAVSPPLASALGRCLALAAVNRAPYGQAVVAVPDPVKSRVRQLPSLASSWGPFTDSTGHH